LPTKGNASFDGSSNTFGYTLAEPRMTETCETLNRTPLKKYQR
jgi:hypothetical protein